MATAILPLLINAADELGIEQPLALYDSHDEGDNSLVRLKRALNRCVNMLAGDWDWQALRREKTHTSLASETQTGMLPTDFRRFVPETMWDRSAKFRLSGPVPASEWQQLKAWNTSAITPFICVRGDAILTYPVPPAGRTYAFEYITKNVGKNVGGTEIAAFAADTDTTWWPDELMITGVVMHYRMIARQDSATEQALFEKQKADAIKQDGGRRVINMRGGTPRSAEARLQAMRSNAVIINNT